MSATPTDLENSIQLALEAAAAANDSAEDVARLSADTQAAADRLDGFAKVMKPVMMGVVAGAVLAIGLGGLVYLRTLSDMRTATATQTEALTLFSKSVADLQAQLDAFNAAIETLAALGPAQAAGFDDLRATLEAQFTEMQIGLSDAASDEANPATTPQMLRSLSQSMQESHVETRADFAAGLSDLQLALTRMLADRPVVQKTQSTAAAPSKPAPVRRARPAPRPEPNPFSFP